MTLWPYKVIWNHWGKYPRIRSFKTFDDACEFVDTYPDTELYIRCDLVRRLA
jgi:hypothetical protein